MNVKNGFCFIVLATAVFFSTSAHAAYLDKDISVSNAWVQAMPPSQKTTAAYMDITNDSKKEAVLISASSDIAGATEIHQMSDTNGMMNMAMVSNVHIPVGGKVRLQPDGLHIMLINLKKPVNQGDIVPITLRFEGGSVMVVNAQVKPQQEEDSSSTPGMKM